MASGLPAGQLSKSDNLHSWWNPERLAEIKIFKENCNKLNQKIKVLLRGAYGTVSGTFRCLTHSKFVTLITSGMMSCCPCGIIINIGDAISLSTGKQHKSTMHRISWEKIPIDTDRYSIPYFVHPNLGK
ncbi:hypothetical protein BDV12DRAFT_205981 [Aspergillus spectabilis]